MCVIHFEYCTKNRTGNTHFCRVVKPCKADFKVGDHGPRCKDPAADTEMPRTKAYEVTDQCKACSGPLNLAAFIEKGRTEEIPVKEKDRVHDFWTKNLRELAWVYVLPVGVMQTFGREKGLTLVQSFDKYTNLIEPAINHANMYSELKVVDPLAHLRGKKKERSVSPL